MDPQIKNSEKEKLCGDVQDHPRVPEPSPRRGGGGEGGKAPPELGGLGGSDRVRRVGRKEGGSTRRPGGSADSILSAC